MLRAFRFALLLCSILSLEACGGGGGGVGENPAVTPPLAPSGPTIFPDVDGEDAQVPSSIPDTPINETESMGHGSLRIFETSTNTTLITFTDGPGGFVKLYDNGYLVADRYLPDDANDPDSKFAKAVVAGGQPRPGTYNDEVSDPKGHKFTGTVTYTDQALVAFTGKENDFSLAHSTFGAWAVSYTGVGDVNRVDGEVQHGPFYRVAFFPFAGSAETKDVTPPTGTYSGPAMAMLSHWTGDGSVFNNAYLTGTAELEVTRGNTASRIALLFPEFADFTLTGDSFDLGNKIYGDEQTPSQLAALSANLHDNAPLGGLDIRDLDEFTLKAAFYTKDSVTEGVGTFHIGGSKMEDPLTGKENGFDLHGAFGVKKP
jgi:hypothetical protein